MGDDDKLDDLFANVFIGAVYHLSIKKTTSLQPFKSAALDKQSEIMTNIINSLALLFYNLISLALLLINNAPLIAHIKYISHLNNN